MIKIKVLEHEFTYKGNIQLRIGKIFTYVFAKGNNSDINYNMQDTFLTNEVESIKGLDNDQ